MQPRVLLSEHDVLRPRDSKTIRVFRFEVPSGTEALSLTLEYSPARPTSVEPIRSEIQAALDEYFTGRVPDEVYAALSPEKKEEIFAWAAEETRNLLHFSLFDPEGTFRGWWDRNPEDDDATVVLFSDVCEPGFVAGEITTGLWRLELEIHSLITERCEFSLTVGSTSKPAALKTSRPVPETLASAEGPRWYRGELHLHTHHSDGRRSLWEMAESGRRAGLDYITVTDHNCTAALSQIHDDLPVTVIPGLEFTMFQGHALALGISRHIPWSENGVPRHPSQLAAEVKDHGGLFCLSHPNTVGDPVCPGCAWTDERLQAAYVDLLEVWHGDYEREAIGTVKNLLLWEALLLEGHRVVAVGGSDIHDLFENEWAAGMPYTMVYAESGSREHLVEGLRRGNVYVTRGPQVDFRVEGAGLSVRMGEEGEFLDGSWYVLRLSASGVGQAGYVRVFRQGQLFVWMPLSSTADTDLAFRCLADREETWYRAEIYRFAKPRDHLLVVTNPIYIRTKPHVFSV